MASDSGIMLFSGRFDRPHIGHAITLARLGAQYNTVKVVILDYPEQEYALAYRMAVLDEVCQSLRGNYEVLTNRVHFGKITREEIEKFLPFTTYGSGNQFVLSHIESLGYHVQFVPRAFDFAASTDRRLQKIQKLLEP